MATNFIPEGTNATPAAFNSRFPAVQVVTGDSTNTTTRAAAVQAAISAAALAGYDTVYVPLSFTPYDASLVTFNNAVKMVREGGSFVDYDVMAYGAAGDGVADDTVAIQRAIDAARVVNNAPTITAITGASVFIPQGIFRVVSSILLYSNIKISGVNRRVTVIQGALTTAIMRLADQTTRANHIIMRDFSVDNTSRDTAGSVGLDLRNVSRSHFDAMRVANAQVGISIDAPVGGGAFYNMFSDMHVTITDTGWFIGTLANDLWMLGGRVSDSTNTGIDLRDCAGIHLMSPSIETFSIGIDFGFATPCTDIRVFGPRLENLPTSGTGLFIRAGNSNVVVIAPLFLNLSTNIANTPSDTIVIHGSEASPADLNAGGGYRQTVDGWFQDNVAASQTAVLLARAAAGTGVDAWIAPRPGSITAISVHSNAARTAGTLTVEVFNNGIATGLTAVLDATNTTFEATTQAKDTDVFVAGDRLDIRITTDAAWLPITADIRANLEVET